MILSQVKPEKSDFGKKSIHLGLDGQPKMAQSRAMPRLGEIIQMARGVKGWSQDRLVEATADPKNGVSAVSKGALQGLETGKTKKPNPGVVMRLVRALGYQTVEEMRRATIGNGDGRAERVMPHFSSLASVAAGWNTGRTDLQMDWQTASELADEWAHNPTAYPDAFSVTVEGDSMEPDFPNGTRVIAAQSAPTETGKVHLVFGLEDNSCLLRIVDVDEDAGTVQLRPLNWRKYESRKYLLEDSSIRIIRVVATWTPLI